MDISITRRHLTDKEHAREMVQDVVTKLVTRYGGSYRWVGDWAHYRFTGMTANLGFDEQQVTVEIKLAATMKVLKSTIEKAINDYMDKRGFS